MEARQALSSWLHVQAHAARLPAGKACGASRAWVSQGLRLCTGSFALIAVPPATPLVKNLPDAPDPQITLSYDLNRAALSFAWLLVYSGVFFTRSWPAECLSSNWPLIKYIE